MSAYNYFLKKFISTWNISFYDLILSHKNNFANRLADQERQVTVSNYQERIVMEDMLRSKTEQLVAQMEREELELIKKLYEFFINSHFDFKI